MKPILLQGHERSITQIKYNREGDLLFSSAKDKKPNVWFSINGERLGTYNGHNGAVWCIDIDWETINFMSGSADNTCKIWDARTGQVKTNYETKNPVRSCGFSYSGNLAMYTTDSTLKENCYIIVRDLRLSEQDSPVHLIDVTGMKFPKITSSIWGSLEDTVITGHETGEIMLWDFRKTSSEPNYKIRPHTKQVMDLQKDKDSTCFISASKDFNSKLFDLENIKELKCFKTEKPVNSAAISPIRDHVLLGGGQEAVDAALYSKSGKFEARFFHLIFEQEFAKVRDHFGPINYVAFHPDGKSYSSAGEDGFVRVHYLDQSYFDFDIKYN
ncbi:eukaryotic translation initiation factor 3 subunit I [Brachionus plicatilis]|uniref:Eukaryotic translation initiation factor 3 subunit I n=1 Tax=Brachionus plicatilis TaxID=10195 RepID=A0A3M7PCB2_BRAPC|nr:eukaryotic translation initiation factor 3 subunit I [Brachionus plicatilis]